MAIKGVVKVHREAKTLARTGFKPAAIWGHEPKASRLRRSVASERRWQACLGASTQAAVPQQPSGSRTRRIRTPSGMGASSSSGRGCTSWWRCSRSGRPRPCLVAYRAEPPSEPETVAQGQGTMSAVIASLLELRWTPAGPALWIDSDGVQFDLDECDHDRLIEYALRGAISEGIWEQASRWHCGGGLHQGPDATILLRHLRRLRHAGAHGEAAVLQMVAAGALWTAGRRSSTESGSPDTSVQPQHEPQYEPQYEEGPAESARTSEQVPQATRGPGFDDPEADFAWTSRRSWPRMAPS